MLAPRAIRGDHRVAIRKRGTAAASFGAILRCWLDEYVLRDIR